MKTGLESCSCSAWRRGGSEEILEYLPTPEGGQQEGWGWTFYKCFEQSCLLRRVTLSCLQYRNFQTILEVRRAHKFCPSQKCCKTLGKCQEQNKGGFLFHRHIKGAVQQIYISMLASSSLMLCEVQIFLTGTLTAEKSLPDLKSERSNGQWVPREKLISLSSFQPQCQLSSKSLLYLHLQNKGVSKKQKAESLGPYLNVAGVFQMFLNQISFLDADFINMGENFSKQVPAALKLKLFYDMRIFKIIIFLVATVNTNEQPCLMIISTLLLRSISPVSNTHKGASFLVSGDRIQSRTKLISEEFFPNSSIFSQLPFIFNFTISFMKI